MDDITLKCITVSDYIINKINKYNEGNELREQVIMTIKRLQKLLYFCDVEYMKINNGNRLFEDQFYAWPSGPVIPNVYYIYAPYYREVSPRYNEMKMNLTEEEKFIIYKVIDGTQKLDTSDLINMTNVSDGPWSKVYDEEDSEHNQVISKNDMYDFYRDKNLFIKLGSIDKKISTKDFTIKSFDNAIVLEKDDQILSIRQELDGDICFSSSKNELIFDLNPASRNYSEWQTYIVFEYLMKSIIGGYILNGENEKDNSLLPNDFVNLEQKKIIWHSDSGRDNVLKIEYLGKNGIRISLIKDEQSKEHYNNSVRIRTSGSRYGYYYQEFLEFFRQLLILEQRLNKPKQEEIVLPKRKTLFKIFKTK